MKIKQKFVIFDVETTGLEAMVDEVVGLGVVVLDGMTGNEVSVFNSILKTTVPISDKTVEITGITQPMSDAGLPQSVAKAYLEGVIDDNTIVVCHNVSFDFSFLARKYGIEPKLFLDTLTLSRVIDSSQKSHKLGSVAERYGINLDNAHRAFHDARATADVLKVFLDGDKRDESIKLMNTLSPGYYGLNYRPKHLKKVIGED